MRIEMHSNGQFFLTDAHGDVYRLAPTAERGNPLHVLLERRGEPDALNRGVEYVVKNRAGQYVGYNGVPTWAPAFAKHFTEMDALLESAAHPPDEGWAAMRAPAL